MAISPEDLLSTPAAYATPTQVAQAREQADRMNKQANSSEKITSPYEGYARITQALMGGLLEQDANREEALGRAAAAIESGQMMGGQGGLVGGGGKPGAEALSPQPAGAPQHGFFNPANYDADAYTKRVWQLESGGNRSAITGSNRGLGQFGPQEERVYGLNDSNWQDPQAQAHALAMESQHNGQILRNVLGRDPTPSELYLAHQQGIGGATAHLLHPDGVAWQNMALTGEGKQKGAGWARQAISGNMLDSWKSQFPSVDAVRSRDFTNLWAQRFNGVPVGKEAPAPSPGQPGQVMSDAGPIGGPGQQLAMGGAGTGVSPSAVPGTPGPGEVSPLLTALQRGYGGPPIVPLQQVATNAPPPPPPGAATTQQGAVVPPPQFRQQAPQIAQAGPQQMPARDPRTGELYPVDPNGVFPMPQNNAAFMRYMQNPWREVFDPGSTARIQQMFQPRTVEDQNGNQWVYSPNQLPYKSKSSLGHEVEVDIPGIGKTKAYDTVGPDGQIRRTLPLPGIAGASSGGAGAGASSGGVGGPMQVYEPFLEEQRQGAARAAGLKTAEEKAADARQVPVTAAIQRGPTAQKEVELLNTMDILSRQTPQALSGPLADTFVELGKGLREITNGALGWDTASAEGIQKLGGQLASLAAREITNRPALAEFKTMVLSNPGIYNSVAGRAMLIDLIRQSAQQDVKLSDMATNADARQWPQLRQQFYNDPKNSLTLHYAGKEYAANKEGVAQFAKDIAPAQTGDLPRITTKEQFDALPSGWDYYNSKGVKNTKQ
jgi:hypothetical protein